ncbi:MAG: hypothetical protein ACRCX8_19590 [Sarcina sp.]
MPDTNIPNVTNTANTSPWNPVKPGQGINSFIPAVWNGGILMEFYEKALTPYITSQPDDIEGGMIIYNFLGEVEVNDYSDSNPNIDYNGVETDPITFTFDYMKSWAFKVTDKQKKQAKNGSFIPKAIVSAGRQMQKAVDTAVLDSMITNATAEGTNLGTITVSANTVYDYLVNIDTEMDKMDMPEEGRYCVINHDIMGMLRKDNRFTFQQQVLRNGNLEGSKIANMTIYTTNYLPGTVGAGSTNSTVQIIAGHPMCWGFGAQLDETEKLRSSTAFADLYRGLYTFGYGPLRAKNFVTATVSLDTSVEPTGLGVIEE